MKLQVLLVLIRMRVVGCHQAVLRYTQGDCVVFSTWPSHRGGLCVAEREPQWERDRVYRSVLQKGGALGLEILRPRCTLLQWEGVGGARRTGARWSGFRSDSQFSRFLSPLWMNPEQANAAVIRGKKSDGPEPLAQAAFIKVVTFVGLYYDFFFFIIIILFQKSCIVCWLVEFLFYGAKYLLGSNYNNNNNGEDVSAKMKPVAHVGKVLKWTQSPQLWFSL